MRASIKSDASITLDFSTARFIDGVEMLRVGIGEVDITPELGLPMVGMPGSPRGEGVRWPLHGRVFLADDSERRAAIVSLDLIALNPPDVARLRALLGTAGGIDPGHILIACSHTHRAPFPFSSSGGAGEGEGHAYFEEVSTRLAAAMTDAIANLQLAELSVGKTLAPGWAFNRRPIFTSGQVGTHGWAWADDFERMEGTPDEEVWTLVAHRADGSIIGGLVGFACHPTAMGHDSVYSADYPGVLTEALAARHGGIFGFLIGAAGDTSTPDPTSHDPESGFGSAHTAAMGKGIADKVDEAIAAASPVMGNRIRVATTRLQIAQRLATPELVKLARWYLEEQPDDIDELDFTRRLSGHDYTFRDGKQVGNARHAEEMLRMWEWQQGPDRQLDEEIEIQAMALGDVALVAFPAEMFTEFGHRVKAASPFRDTFVVTLANGWHGYVPTLEAFSRGGYEPRFAYPSRLVEEAGDQMTEAAIRLLQELRSPA
jgi:neutral ceramidase